MSQVRCVIQADSDADRMRAELERRLAESHAKYYPDEHTTYSWMPIPAGYMFTEGKPSTSSVVSFFIDHTTTLDIRAAYLRDACTNWTDVTDCTDHEVVVTITETVNDQD